MEFQFTPEAFVYFRSYVGK